MIYNTILVSLSMHESVSKQLKFARDVASRFEATLVGFAAGDIRIITAAPPGVIMDDEFMRLEAIDIERRLETLKKEFEEEEGGMDQLRTRVGDPTKELAAAARLGDLVIAGMSQVGSEYVDIGELIHSAGRPVLIPRADLEPLAAHKVVVAWKDTREARRAVVDAMPFLVHAREVLVASVEDQGRHHALETLNDVVRHLIHHGARARGEIFSCNAPSDGEALISITKQFGADLIVSGAYGHSRLREWLVGGVTRSLLRETTLNRLMSS
ncbi:MULTISPECIES: universal stress protein [Ensifer]|uniref:universal stress protein n=1 Tax=Ensifer TaxID=106591 RepID=UPI000DD57DAC|nr:MULTISPECIES: universal stress protein [Ensifer]MCY1746305.1 universal stress protein [Ensifer sp. SL37]